MTTKRHDEHNPAEDTNHPVGETIPEITDRLQQAVQHYTTHGGAHMKTLTAHQLLERINMTTILKLHVDRSTDGIIHLLRTWAANKGYELSPANAMAAIIIARDNRDGV